MSLTIKRKKDNRVVKCILHRVADIPGGVTVSVANLGGSALFEGTPLAKGSNGLYVVCKTAQVITEATATATTYEVAKGHHFKVGDRFATAACNGQLITAIESSHAIAYARKLAPTMEKEQIVVVNISGRGDKERPLCRKGRYHRRNNTWCSGCRRNLCI